MPTTDFARNRKRVRVLTTSFLTRGRIPRWRRASLLELLVSYRALGLCSLNFVSLALDADAALAGAAGHINRELLRLTSDRES